MPSPHASPSTAGDEIVRKFVEHWSAMARLWGINATMAELFALMYITGGDWSADELRAQLRISRGNVSMNLRELLGWGVVHKVHRPGQRREFFRAETDVWTLFRRIITERKRREIEPTRELLAETARRIPRAEGMEGVRERALALWRFFETINTLATRLIALAPHDLQNLLELIDQRREPGPRRRTRRRGRKGVRNRSPE
jgi:DNA-binding transcriptional regulator GbsR (MarR family)